MKTIIELLEKDGDLTDDVAMTTTEAASALGVNRSRVRQLILGGRLPATKIGRDWIIRRGDLALVKDRKPGRPKSRP
jgi:excisionase family DNA binding protein